MSATLGPMFYGRPSCAAQLNSDTDFTSDSIERVRVPKEQLAGGGTSHTGVSPVPEDALKGHAYHTYSLVSEDGQVEFQFRHNVNGRSTYAEVRRARRIRLPRGCRLNLEPAPPVEPPWLKRLTPRPLLAQGTVDAAVFLAARITSGSGQRIFNMVDVLKAGAM